MISYDTVLKKVESIIGDSTTFQSQLDDLGHKLFGNRYKGSHSSDQIPHLKNKECGIINLDPHYLPGSHWVAVYKENGKLCVYDSFGRQTKKILPDALEGNGPVRDSKHDAEQKISESNCGARALAWLVYIDTYGANEALKI